jgi:hypothetical protein
MDQSWLLEMEFIHKRKEKWNAFDLSETKDLVEGVKGHQGLSLRDANLLLAERQEELGAALYELGATANAISGSGFPYFSRAAKLGHAQSAFELGQCYLNGRGVEKDINKALIWFQAAANMGLEIAQYELGDIYYKGEVVPQDKPRGLLLMRLAAKQGGLGAYVLANTLYNHDRQEDKKEAIYFWKRAAALEPTVNFVKCILAYLYMHGYSVEQDVVYAIELLKEFLNELPNVREAQLIFAYIYSDQALGVYLEKEAVHYYSLASFSFLNKPQPFVMELILGDNTFLQLIGKRILAIGKFIGDDMAAVYAKFPGFFDRK